MSLTIRPAGIQFGAVNFKDLKPGTVVTLTPQTGSGDVTPEPHDHIRILEAPSAQNLVLKDRQADGRMIDFHILKVEVAKVLNNCLALLLKKESGIRMSLVQQETGETVSLKPGQFPLGCDAETGINESLEIVSLPED